MPVTADLAGFAAYLDGEIAAYLGDDLGPRIKDDAVRYAPLGVSTPATSRWPAHEAGELKASIEDHLEGPRTLIVAAHAPYAVYVDWGPPAQYRRARPVVAARLDAVRTSTSGRTSTTPVPRRAVSPAALCQERA